MSHCLIQDFSDLGGDNVKITGFDVELDLLGELGVAGLERRGVHFINIS